ncbi:MAG: hypothetical protein EPO23_00860 [Xanthobacteraceae bacterium]|nr:MAG: hypothetical protein EPO23_00860 [Xanthobacteraceae bacterium]
MRRIFFIAAAGMSLAGCGSVSMPSMDFFSSAPPEAPLKLESTPPGADARTSLGPACKTPCVVTVPASGSFTVTFTLDKHQPQTVPVQAVQGEGVGDAGYGQQPPAFDPNPVYVELAPALPPRKRPVKKKPAAKPKAAAAAPAAAGSSPFPDANSAAFPPPDRR